MKRIQLPGFFLAALLAVLVGGVLARLGAQTPAAMPPAVGAANPAASLFSQLRWRNIGPAGTGGRIVDFAVVEATPDVVYAASATGGVWKTLNGGATWTAVFDRGRTASVGAIAVAPSQPGTVWVGTGEAWNARSNSWGDWGYRLSDGGRTWRHMGLARLQHVGRIIIHPTNPDIVYVAAMGALWAANEERGLYRTSDGGETWTRVLHVSAHTGVVDVTMDPADPNVVYAAAFQRERRNWSMLAGGPESALYRSTDGGMSWQRLTNGLPSGHVGRIGLATCASAPGTVYAAFDARDEERGVYRSLDRATTWERRTGEVFTRSGYGQVRCDPRHADRVYVLDTNSVVSEDGGQTFRRFTAANVHADHHALWIDPANTEHLWLGTDGGIYRSSDRGQSWDFTSHLVLAQFYTVAADLREPFYFVYGGTQDNNSLGGPSATRHADGIVNDDWFVTVPGDGFHVQIDPMDPAVVYTESQYGRLVRFDARTGERRLIQPEPPEGQAYRWNWSAPVVVSQHHPRTVYFAANVVFRSRNRGDAWDVISPDLTRQTSHFDLPMQGRIQPRDALGLHQSTADYGNVQTLAESALRPGLLAAGTDDGVIHVSEDDGRNWRRIEKFPTVPEQTLVSKIVFSRFDAGTLYAAFDAHQDNDFRPFVLKSADLGRTWRAITGDLPVLASTRVVIEHPRNRDVLLVGTESGVYVSMTGGDRWVNLNNNLPTVPVYDILVHPRENDIVLGTHGRGFWILDDSAIIDELTPDALARGTHLARIRAATQFQRFDRGRRNQGDRFFSAPNPPEGAIITYLSSSPRPAGPPGAGQPAEAEIDVLAPDGSIVRRLEPPAADLAPGVRRVTWDLRHGLTTSAGDGEGDESIVQRLRGPLVLPGTYRVRLRAAGRELVQPVVVKPDPLSTTNDADRRTWHDTLLHLDRLHASSRAATAAATALRNDLRRARDQLGAAAAPGQGAPPAAPLAEDLDTVIRSLEASLVALRGAEELRRSAEQPGALPIVDRIRQTYAAIEASPGVPTQDLERSVQRSEERLTSEVGRVRAAISDSLPALNERLGRARIPMIVAPALDGPPKRPAGALARP